MSATIESVLSEKRVFPPTPAFVQQANIYGKGEEIKQDVLTLENPQILEQLKQSM
jgi:hypothetical protein